jgi:hypothetical protein
MAERLTPGLFRASAMAESVLWVVMWVSQSARCLWSKKGLLPAQGLKVVVDSSRPSPDADEWGGGAEVEDRRADVDE